MKRKYLPIEKYPVYNGWVNKLQLESSILNGGSEKMISAYSTLWDKYNLEAELRVIVGDTDGFHTKENGTKSISHIPFVQMRLKEINQAFKIYQRERQNKGYEKPTQMPKNLQDQFYEFEARFTVLHTEKETIETKLKQMKEAVQKTDDSKVLENGLKCGFHNHGLNAADPEMMNTMKEIDGQMVNQLRDGTLYIDDSRSPYDGLSVPDYRKLAKIWHSDRLKADTEMLAKMQIEAKENGLPRPAETGRNWCASVSLKSLPPFPDWATNHKKKSELLCETVKRKPKYDTFPKSNKNIKITLDD